MTDLDRLIAEADPEGKLEKVREWEHHKTHPADDLPPLSWGHARIADDALARIESNCRRAEL